MQTFSNNDIEEAKKRVREMKKKAESYSNGPVAFSAERNFENLNENQKINNEKEETAKPKTKEEDEEKDSSFLILILLLLLSHEGADNKLLLALLYLLL